MKSKYILDACAPIALFADEQGAEIVAGPIDKAYSSEIELYMSKINLLEVYYGILRDLGKEAAEKVFSETLDSPIAIIDLLGDDVFREAGRLKAAYKISFADAIALGHASVMRLSLVTADHHEFDILEPVENLLSA